MLDPFTQLFQYCWGHARWLRMIYKDLWVVLSGGGSGSGSGSGSAAAAAAAVVMEVLVSK